MSRPDYETAALIRKGKLDAATGTTSRVPDTAGLRDRWLRVKRLKSGRLAFIQHLQTLAALAQFDQADRNQKREERTRPEVLGVLCSKQVINEHGVEETVVTSELRREHWPEPRPIIEGGIDRGYNTERLAETDRERANPVVGPIVNRIKNLFS